MRKLVLFLCLVWVSSLSVSAQVGSVSIPIDSDSYKIVVSEDGIYEVSYEALQTAGMDVAAVNPNTFEMMHKGEPMAYQLIGDGDDVFESGESVRFFGWAFDGSNHDSWFVDENYYWLWANGSPTMVDVRPGNGDGVAVDSWRSTLIFEQDNLYHPTFSNGWELFEFEADAWFMAQIATNPAGVDIGAGSWNVPNPAVSITPEMGQSFRQYTVDVFDPVNDGADATLTTEVFSRCRSPQITRHTFATSMNGIQHIDQWEERYGRTFEQNLPADSLIDGDNLLRYDALTPQEDINPYAGCGSQQFNSDLLMPNRSILEYDRRLAAVDDQLRFSTDQSGSHRFMVSNFSVENRDSAVVWEITNWTTPSVITLSDDDITNENGAFTWAIGDDNVANGEYIATAVVKTPDSVSQYIAPTLTQAGVEWLGVSHANFIGQARRLGDYRSGTATDLTLTSGTTISATPEVTRNALVVDVADVINQYGYGYNTPQAIQAYFHDAYTDWANGELKYGVLFGDATINPRQLACIEQCDDRGEWDTSFETFVVTDLTFSDRFVGLAPTDHTFANLLDDGSQLGVIPEIAIGRFAVNTPEEAANMVDKVILYEHNQQIDAPYMENLVFIADNADAAGDFCQLVRTITDEIDEERSTFLIERDYVNEFSAFVDGTNLNNGDAYCVDNYMDNGLSESAAATLVRDNSMAEINSTGAAIVNYRGHGSRFALGDYVFDSSVDLYESGGIFNANRDVDDSFIPGNGGLFTNYDQPTLWLSGNCLDGDFTFPSHRESAFSERIMRLGELAGAVGHWSSVGFGFSLEHVALHQGFYESLYTDTAAINPETGVPINPATGEPEFDANGEPILFPTPRGPYTIGDAIVYAKTRYLIDEMGHVSTIWSFVYQGDPGMVMPAATFVQDYGDYESQINAPTALAFRQSIVAQHDLLIVLLSATVLLAIITVFDIHGRIKKHDR